MKQAIPLIAVMFAANNQHAVGPIDPVRFGVAGYCLQESYDVKRGSSSQVHRIDFTVHVEHPKYLIASKKLDDLEEGEVAALEAGYDGENSFSITICPEPGGNISVHPTKSPQRGLVHEHVLWLAYCTGQRIGSGKRLDSPHPGLWEVEHLTSGYGPTEVRTTSEIALQKPCLPERVEIFSPQYWVDERTGKRQPIASAFPVCKYMVKSWKEVDGLKIPAEFYLENFVWMPPADGRAAGPVLRTRLVFSATNVFREFPALSALSRLSRRYEVFDYRFQGELGRGEAVAYYTTEQAILPKDHKVVREAFINARKALKEEKAQNSGKRRLLWFWR